MKDKYSTEKSKNVFRIIGIIFVIVYSVILIRKLPVYGISSAIWYCDWIMLFAGVALIFNKRKILSPLLMQSIMVQSPWLIDTFFLSAFGMQTMNLSNYLFNDWPIFDFILALRHFFVIPVLIIFFLGQDFYKGKLFHFLVSTVSYIFVMGLTVLVTQPATNTNCAFKACISFFPNFKSLIAYHLFFIILLALVYCLLFYAIPRMITKMRTNRSRSIKAILSLFCILAIVTIGKYLLISL